MGSASGISEDEGEGRPGLATWPMRTRVTLAIALVVCCGWMLYGWHIAQRGLWSSHEGRAAQNAQMMLDEGNWIVPRLYTGEPELQKPAMYYWVVAALGYLNDGRVTPMEVRLPATIAGILGLVAVFLLGWRMWDMEAGLWAAAMLACITRYAWLSRVGRIDMPLCLIIITTLALFWNTDRARRAGDTGAKVPLVVFLLLGIGVLFKGPVAVVLFSLPVATYLWLSGVPVIPFAQRGAWGTWGWCRVLPGLAVVIAVTAPWFWAVSVATEGEFFWSFFVYHNWERAAGTTEALKSGPVWFYVPRLFVDAFPWSLLLPAFWLSMARHRKRWLPTSFKTGLEPGQDPNVLFLVSWAVSQFVFLSVVSFKRADYLLPVFPAMALLWAGWLRERGWRRQTEVMLARIRHPRRRRRFVAISAAVLTALTAPLLVWAGIEFHESGLVDTLLKIDLLREHLNETDLFMMTHVERIVQGSGPILFIGGIVIVVSVWLFHTGWHQSLHRRLLFGLGLPWLVGFLFQIHVLLPALDPLREMSRFASAIRAVAGPEATVYYFGKFDSDLAFHIGRPAKAMEDWEQLAALAQSGERCYVVMKASQLEWIKRDPRTAAWEPIVDNTKLAFGGHRDHRLLLTTRPDAIAQGGAVRDNAKIKR